MKKQLITLAIITSGLCASQYTLQVRGGDVDVKIGAGAITKMKNNASLKLHEGDLVLYKAGAGSIVILEDKNEIVKLSAKDSQNFEVPSDGLMSKILTGAWHGVAHKFSPVEYSKKAGAATRSSTKNSQSESSIVVTKNQPLAFCPESKTQTKDGSFYTLNLIVDETVVYNKVSPQGLFLLPYEQVSKICQGMCYYELLRTDENHKQSSVEFGSVAVN